MRPILSLGCAPLPADEVRKMLKRHIPYRQWLLDDAVSRIPAKTNQDNQSFEAGTLSGRILLSFLGVAFDEKTGRLREDREHKPRRRPTDDVKIRDVGGRFVELAELSTTETKTLEKFIRGANKACAHFTVGSDHELTVETYQQAVPIIQRLVQACLPQP